MNKSVTYSPDLANALRFLAIDAVEAAKSGHPGMPMGMADVATVLLTQHLRFSAQHPLWPNRDRLVLSAGHGSMLLYGLLYLTGYSALTLEDLKHFRQWGYPTAGHPEVNQAMGIETTAGPLGQGLGNAVGMALAEKLLESRFENGVYDYHTYCIVGDGCLMEGISQEAISFAGHYQLSNLTVLFDNNHISIDGPTSLSTSENHLQRFEACGWKTMAIDGHDPVAIDGALRWAKAQTVPTLIACRTQIGFGSPSKAGTSGVHGSPLGKDEIAATRKKLAWPHEPFVIPQAIMDAWRHVGSVHGPEAQAWLEHHHDKTLTLDQSLVKTTLDAYKADLSAACPHAATRSSSSQVIERLMAVAPNIMIAGSADLTPSNLTKASKTTALTAETFRGSYIHYGIREHAMAAIMNGLCLSGFRPFGGTFLVFSDYLRPALRLSALMHQPVIYVLTHDSIGLGEDGPTHQPIEHLAALRAIPNVQVLRPMDAIEVVECWQLALESTSQPTILALSRQNLPTLRSENTTNLSAYGGYVLRGDAGKSILTLCATGSEVELAWKVAELLDQKGMACHIVSLPCIERFLQQDLDYQHRCIPKKNPVFGLEAASSFGWDRLIQSRGLFFGLDHFGASAPYTKLYDEFGLNPSDIAEKICHYLKNREENHD